MQVTLRKDRLIVVAIGLLLIAAAAVYLALQHAPELNLNIENDRVLLAALSIVMTLLGIALLFVLLRNLIKLLVERRREVLGSRFRTKLVFIFLVLVLIPSVALLAAAASLIRHIDETLFNQPLERIVEDSKSIMDDYLRVSRVDCSRFGSRIAAEIAARRLLAPERAGELESRTASWGAEDGLDFVAVYDRREDGSMAPLASWARVSDKPRPPIPDAAMPDEAGMSGAVTPRRAAAPGPEGSAPDASPPDGAVTGTVPGGTGPPDSAMPDGTAGDAGPGPERAKAVGPDGTGASTVRPSEGGRGADPGKQRTIPRLHVGETVRGVLDSGEAAHRLDRAGAWQIVTAAAPIRSPFGGAAGTVLVGRFVPPDMASRTDTIDRTFRDFRRTLKNQPSIKRVYILLFLILTLLVLFAATWAGFYLARQISVPIQALAEGTKAITSGDLDHRVEAQAGDEIGLLIDSFNRMTQELRSNREAIEASRRQLQDSYSQLEERRQYIEQLLENVPAAVISVDPRGNVTTMNRAAFRLLRLDASKPSLGLRASEVFAREELQPLVNEIEDLRREEAPSHVQEFDFTIEGRPVHLAANLSTRRDAEGRFQGALIVMEDLTPLIRSQKTAAWREVARRIAHEIKNPLTPIQLSAQRVLKKFSEQSPEFPAILAEGWDPLESTCRHASLSIL